MKNEKVLHNVHTTVLSASILALVPSRPSVSYCSQSKLAVLTALKSRTLVALSTSLSSIKSYMLKL